MNKLIGSFVLLFSANVLFSQGKIEGVVKDQEGTPLIGAFVHLENTFLYNTTNQAGEFSYENLAAGDYTLYITYLGFEDLIHDVSVKDGEVSSVDLKMAVRPFTAEEVVVRGLRADRNIPMAYSDISAEQLAEVNLGMDVPELLNTTPSLYFTSDAGNGVGYTYLRLRGSDQTNVNVMINGIPLNDAESHGVFWVDLPDLATSTQSIQIQRGVGTSSNGAGAFGGSINLLTEGVSTEAYGELSAGFGSYNTNKQSAKFGTGLLNNHWTIDGRLSQISSDGYIDRSYSDLSSYYLAASYSDDKNSIRAITFGGHEVTNQAWWGVPEGRLTGDEDLMLAFAYDNGYTQADIDNLLNSDRRFNYYRYDQEVDDYGQDHYQLHYNRRIRKGVLLNVAGHYTKGKGFFEQFQDKENWSHDSNFEYYGLENPIFGSDTLTNSNFIRRRWLDNDFYGAIWSLNVKRGKTDTWIGGGLNQYEGGHFGEVIWSEFASGSEVRDRYYENDSKKSEINVYAKTSYSISNSISMYGDVQFRHIEYSFLGNLPSGIQANQSLTYDFFNPKVGVTFRPSDRQRGFVSLAIGNKEPNRDDLTSSTFNSRPEHQTMMDVEVGYGLQHKNYAVDVVLYTMAYNNQLIATGEINDVGESVRTNVDESYRQGIEFIAKWTPVNRLSWGINVGLSKNKIVDFVDFEGLNQQPRMTDIAFSPNVIIGNDLSFKILQGKKVNSPKLKATFFSKYVGDQFLDNTSSENKKIDAFFVNDLRFNFSVGGRRLKGLDLTFMIRNILDEQYASNGWTYKYFTGSSPEDEVTFNAYYPQAGRNLMSGLTLRF